MLKTKRVSILAISLMALGLLTIGNNIKPTSANAQVTAPTITKISYKSIKVNHNNKRHKRHKLIKRTPKYQNNNISQRRQTEAAQPQQVSIKYKPTPIQQTTNKSNNNWFNAGLSKTEINARQAIVNSESGGHWNILSYGRRCIGYFQLDPGYLGYKHGHVNLDHKHQVRAANKYVRNRYGSWVNALHFRRTHGYY